MSKNLSVILLTVAFTSLAYGQPKKGYITNIDKETIKNENLPKGAFYWPTQSAGCHESQAWAGHWQRSS